MENLSSHASVSAASIAFLRALWLAAGLCIFCANPAGADEASALEQQVKAAFLFKFSGYVEWPQHAFPDPGSPLVIGVAGDDSLAEELTRVVGNRTMNGRTVAVRLIRSGESIADLHVLFVSRSQLARLGELSSHPRPVLTVTDVAMGLEQGSVINFLTAGNRIRFEVSLDAARRNALKIGAPLLSVAMRVQG
jgi:hypothetical protein